jgi:hypothetical protein
MPTVTYCRHHKSVDGVCSLKKFCQGNSYIDVKAARSTKDVGLKLQILAISKCRNLQFLRYEYTTGGTEVGRDMLDSNFETSQIMFI